MLFMSRFLFCLLFKFKFWKCIQYVVFNVDPTAWSVFIYLFIYQGAAKENTLIASDVTWHKSDVTEWAPTVK